MKLVYPTSIIVTKQPQNRIIPKTGTYRIYINSLCGPRDRAYDITAQTTCAQLKEMHFRNGGYTPQVQYLVWDHEMKWIPEAEVLSERGIGPDCLIHEIFPIWAYREVAR